MTLHLEIVPRPPTRWFLWNNIRMLGELAIAPIDDLEDLRSQRLARIVNRNEPFGSILESPNSHFSILLTNPKPARGRIEGRFQRTIRIAPSTEIRCAGVPRSRKPCRARTDAMSFSCRRFAGRRD